MALGPGNYDAECTAARLSAKAQGAILIIFDGARGGGFSVQWPAHLLVPLPRVLRQIADSIEQETAQHERAAKEN